MGATAAAANVKKMDEYIQYSLKESKQKALINNIYTFIKDPLPEGLDLDYVLETVKKTIPEHLVYGLDSIFIGQFDEIESKEMNALYKDGSIYVTNNQTNEEDLIDDIIHEIAHLAEERLGQHIYEDRTVIDEFLGKRGRLYEIIKSEGYEIPREYFYELEYNEKFDSFLYTDVGYEKLTFLTMGLFVSPYAATSLREYFAKSFQLYFMGEMEHVRKVSPVVFQKIEYLVFKKYE